MYRRATTNSYSPRVSSFIESMGKDDTINNLKKEYSQNRSIESEYDTLTSEIAKIERENERIQQQHIKTEADYKEKIEMSENFMQELCLQINELEENIKKGPNLELKEKKKKETVEEIEKLCFKMREGEIENKILEEETNKQELMMVKLGETMKELLEEKEKVEANVKVYVQNIQELKEKLANWETKTHQMHVRCQQLEEENSKISEEAVGLKEKISVSLSKNQNHTEKLRLLETAFKETIHGLEAKRTSKEKLALNYYEVHNEINKIEESLKKFCFMIEDQENSNKELINNLKKSIKNDEEAVKVLARKAAILALISK